MKKRKKLGTMEMNKIMMLMKRMTFISLLRIA